VRNIFEYLDIRSHSWYYFLHLFLKISSANKNMFIFQYFNFIFDLKKYVEYIYFHITFQFIEDMSIFFWWKLYLYILIMSSTIKKITISFLIIIFWGYENRKKYKKINVFLSILFDFFFQFQIPFISFLCKFYINKRYANIYIYQIIFW
jgi:hypothetical protein